MRKFKLFGSRIVKTGLAVFFTALICQWLNWPPVFAVITAIVTIEPTVGDSIKKGIVRFPASAIGSAFAVLFIFLFDNSAITYTAAAVCTIITCYKLKLHDGLLVATLTSVAMIEVIHSNLLISFFIRLGTTSVGLIVSTVVNMFVLPPDYSDKIHSNAHYLLKTTGEGLEHITKLALLGKSEQDNISTVQDIFAQLKKKLDRTEMLVQYQKAESKYHRLNDLQQEHLLDDEENVAILRLIHYHIGNLINTPFNHIEWSEKECHQIITTVETMAEVMRHPEKFKLDKHRAVVHNLMDEFWKTEDYVSNEKTDGNPNFFSAETIILYELVSIFNLVEDLLVDE